ncbi:MAG TPA: hypothetical protein VKT80_17110, partial [Chloroflexota bacterium]|nr:hypothetical protein [Chloroflexota bacterium]
AIVTGGAIASMLLREKVNDFDVYFRTRDACRIVIDYYIKRFQPKTAAGIPCKISIDDARDDRISIVIKSSGIASEDGTERDYEYFEGRAEGDPAAEAYIGEVMSDPGAIEDAYEETETKALETEDDGRPRYRPVFMSTNAITLSHRVQLVCRFFGEPDQIHENYDFVHCTNYWKSWDDELVLRKEALEALLARELRYVGSKYPLCSLIRVRKFTARGWTINAGQILKMAMQVSKLDLTDYGVLRDQLTGVDAAYFMQVISALHSQNPEKVDYAYLVEIIDRMF